jgi:uncharacterized protein YbjT (DUF2867 family)
MRVSPTQRNRGRRWKQAALSAYSCDMRILLTGAAGFIGSAILARLQASGHEVWAVTRRRGSAVHRRRPECWIELDVARAVRPDDWRPHLEGVDAVVNCAGVLQDGATDSTTGVHVEGPAALFAACEASGVRRVVQISAMGADHTAPTDFSRSKARCDAALAERDLDWVILRPSVVVGRAAYGGSALFRALAALPVMPAVRDAGELQVVQVDDVAETVTFFVEPEAPSRVILELGGPDRLDFEALIARYRRWLGYPPARRVPGASLLPLLFRLGDLAGLLGWRPPIRSTARRELLRGAVGDPVPWVRMTGIRPRSLDATLTAEPASVQERWFANLYLLKALVLAITSLFWIVTGLVSLGPGYAAAETLLRRAAAGDLAGPGVLAGAAADLVLGLGIAWRRTARPALWGALLLSAFYLAATTALAPELWAEPLGPLTKVAPIMVLNMVALAILEDR